MTILSKFENDIKTRSQMVDYLHKKVGEVKVVYDQFQYCPSQFQLCDAGDELHVTAGVGRVQFFRSSPDKYQRPVMNLNASVRPSYSTRLKRMRNTVMVHIHYPNPTALLSIRQPVKYTVGRPQAPPSPGKDERIICRRRKSLIVSAGSVGREKMHISIYRAELP